MKTILFLIIATSVSTLAFDEQADELRRLRNQMQDNATMRMASEAQKNSHTQVATGDLPISQMTDVGALMALSQNAPVKGKNAAMGAEIRRQVAARLKELAIQPASDGRVNPGQLKYGESKLPPRKTASPSAITMVDASGKLVPYNDLNVAMISSADAKLTKEQFEANVQKAEAMVVSAYPCAKIENHPIHAKAEEIFSALEQINSPLSKLSTSSWIVYQQAAQSLGIAPQSVTSP